MEKLDRRVEDRILKSLDAFQLFISRVQDNLVRQR